MSKWNPRSGVKGIIGNGYESLEQFAGRVSAVQRVRKSISKGPVLTRTPFAQGKLKEQKYHLKKRWQEGVIPTNVYIDWLLSHNYNPMVVLREVGRKEMDTFLDAQREQIAQGVRELKPDTVVLKDDEEISE